MTPTTTPTDDGAAATAGGMRCHGSRGRAPVTGTGDTAWVRHALAELGRAGHRPGGARTAVLEGMAAAGCCRTAQELHDALRAEGRRVGIASVYRALDQLVSLRLATRIEFGDGVARFEPTLPGGHHHHHMVCTGCGTVRPFEDPALERAIVGLGRREGFRVSDHDVVLRGHCPECSGGAP